MGCESWPCPGPCRHQGRGLVSQGPAGERVETPTGRSDPREGVSSGQSQHYAQACMGGHESGDVVGLEGSCQEAIPLPSTTFDTFFVVFRSAHTTPLGHLRRIRVFIPVASAPMRRTSHPSGSRPLNVSLLSQTSAPGIVNAPENPRFPAVSNRVQCTDNMAPSRVHLFQGSRQRRRMIGPCGGRPSVMG
jgi:hypothetical protein